MKQPIADTQKSQSTGLLLQQAMEYHQSGQLLKAKELYTQILNIDATHPDALHLLGLISHQLGDSQRAIMLIKQAIARSPSAPMYSNLGVVYQATSNFAEAETCYRESLVLNPMDANTHFNLANALKHQHKLADAISSYQRALDIRPDFAEAYYNIGNTFKVLNDHESAIHHYRQAISIRASYPEALTNLGLLLLETDNPEQAEHCFKQALAINHELPESHFNLGNAEKQLDRIDKAVSCYQQAITLNPQYIEAHYNLGLMLVKQEKLDDAISSFKSAIAIDPAFVDAYTQLAYAYTAQNNLKEAESLLYKAISIKPDSAEAYCALGHAIGLLGNVDGSITQYRHALSLKPDLEQIHSILIFSMDMSLNTDVHALQNERKHWGKLFADKLLDDTPFRNANDPDKKLRIGYVSSDFKKHSAVYVFSAMLLEFDRSAFEIYIYSNLDGGDAYTRLLENNATGWRNILGMPDESVAELIRADEIDILVDLSGHSGGNRLLVFARKPAPIQITAWGYIGGTGMKAMDVFFADEVVVPPDERALYAEEVRYLPSVVCYYPFEPFPPVNALPALMGLGVTFGSFNRLVKVTEETFTVWAEVLLAVPHSRMVLKTPELEDASTRARVLERFVAAGVAAERVVLLGRTSWAEHVAAFNQVDVGLDPFPHGGGVTALEGLMMGVPVVTLKWPSLVGRLSAAILTPMELTDWIADSPEAYVRIAVEKSRDLMALSVLRKQLRGRMTSSLIGDPKAYARAVESEYQSLWQEWCAR